MEIRELDSPSLQTELWWRHQELEYAAQELEKEIEALCTDREALKWAVSVCRSRAIAGCARNPKADQGSETAAVDLSPPMLVPIVDMCNHAAREIANAALAEEFDALTGNRFKIIVALRPIPKDEEVLVTYEAGGDVGGGGSGGSRGGGVR